MILTEVITELKSLDRGLILAGKQTALEIRQSILASVDAYGARFKPNSARTIARKKSSRPLIASGRMLNSFYVQNQGRLNLLIANNSKYSAQHNEGVGVPRRTFLDADVVAGQLADIIVNKSRYIS